MYSVITMSEKKSFGVKVTLEQKTFIDDTLKDFSKNNNESNKGTALYKLVKHYYEFIQSSDQSSNYVPETIKETMALINCDYLEYQDEFICLEAMSKKKKVEPIAISPEQVLLRCKACKRKRAEDIIDERNKELRKENIKKLMRFMHEFTQVSASGFEITNFMCTGRQLESNELIFSRDGLSMYCPKLEMDLIHITEECLQRINPDTKEKPCECLISLSQHIKFNKEFWENIDVQLPSLTYTDKELNEIYDKNMQDMEHVVDSVNRQIDAEYEIKEEKVSKKDEE